LTGEWARTATQLRLFAELVRDGSWKGVRRDAALPDRQPARRPDLRRTLVPIGPVAIWPASNFPLAFSVAGGDTASALAASCPVVVKAHPGHPGTSELTAQAVVRAIAQSGLPAGMFSLAAGRQPRSQSRADPAPANRSRRVHGIAGSRASAVRRGRASAGTDSFLRGDG